jgi:type IV pilus assembly protein PilM
MGSMNNTYFYHDKPVFGLDIGFQSLKVMQLESSNKKHSVTGYGVASFDPAAIKDGVIVDPEGIAAKMQDLFAKHLIGEITTRRAVATIPASRTFTRTMTLPVLSDKDLAEAVQLEAEQYIPMPLEDLYMDYMTISKSDKEIELLAVAVPKKIVDSYVTLTQLTGIEVIAFETNINAASRIFVHAEQSDVPTILIDFGSVSADITIYDKALIVTGTVAGGGDNFSNLIADKLGVTRQEAHIIKTKYGLGVSKKQKEITDSVTPLIDQLLKEIRRMIRYYEERSGSSDNRKIGQVVTMGGGANMPGLSEHMTNVLRLPVRTCDPWRHLDFSDLQPPNTIEKSMYVTVAGLSLLNQKDIFA